MNINKKVESVAPVDLIIILAQPRVTCKVSTQIRLTCGHVSGRLTWLVAATGRHSTPWVAPFPKMVLVPKKVAKLEPMIEPPGFRLSSCPDFLQWWIVNFRYKPNKPFPTLSCFWSQCFITATEMKPKLGYHVRKETLKRIQLKEVAI